MKALDIVLDIVKGKKKKEPPTAEELEKHGIRAVIKFNKHCEGCATKVLKSCKRMTGVSEAYLDATRPLVTVIGVFETNKLIERIREKCRRRAELVEQAKIGEKTKEDGGGASSGGGQGSIKAVVKENKPEMEEKKQTEKGKQVMEEGQASNGGQQGN